MSRRDREGRIRLVLLAAPVALGLTIAAGLAWQAHTAAREHRAAMERVVRDHADFAAYLLLRVSLESLERYALYGFGPVLRRGPGTALPAAAELGADPSEFRRCPLPGTDSARIYARLDPAAGTLTTAGEVPDAETRRWLRDTLAVLARTAPAGGGLRHAIRAGDGEPRMIAFLVARSGEYGPSAVYASNGCFAERDATVFDMALRTTTALPPSLTAGAPNGSLLSVRVFDAAGRMLYTSPAQWSSPWKGTAGPLPSFGGLTLEVTLREGAAERLVVGGLPASRLPQALALLALATLLAGVAILQVYRQFELVRLRERFMRNASHELRTPLQQILLYADLLRLNQLAEAKDQRRALDVIDTETRRLIHLVDGVLRFTRAGERDVREAGEARRIQPGKTVRATVDAFRPLAAARNVTIDTHINDQLTVRASAESVRQVTLNLLDNAVKYGPIGQTVHVSVAASNGKAVLTVEDEGPGVPASDRVRIFAPFERLSRDETGGTPGTGIGLAIVRDLVERDGGSVRADAAKMGGARFVVEWPVVEAS